MSHMNHRMFLANNTSSQGSTAYKMTSVGIIGSSELLFEASVILLTPPLYDPIWLFWPIT